MVIVTPISSDARAILAQYLLMFMHRMALLAFTKMRLHVQHYNMPNMILFGNMHFDQLRNYYDQDHNENEEQWGEIKR